VALPGAVPFVPGGHGLQEDNPEDLSTEYEPLGQLTQEVL